MASLSIWEKESFYRPRDIIIIGSGLSGLWAAWHLIKKEPSLSIAIVDKGLIPSGASTRNAGFACFGSLTELMHDRETMGTDQMLELVEMRYRGLQKIMKTFNPATIDFSLCGGYELLANKASVKHHTDPESAIEQINNLIREVTKTPETFQLADQKIGQFGFSGLQHLVENKLEGYLHSGMLVQSLLQAVQSAGVQVLTGMDIRSFEKTNNSYILQVDNGPELRAGRLLICTNGFAAKLLPGLDLVPARGQVLLTGEIPDLAFRGTFHADEGFYYFRNLGKRILLGGARNLDLEGEQSSEMNTTKHIQEALEAFLQKHIIPGKSYTITDRWSGIMAMGKKGKMPILEETQDGVFCAVRMSGMGVALTPVVGEMIAAKMLGED